MSHMLPQISTKSNSMEVETLKLKREGLEFDKKTDLGI